MGWRMSGALASKAWNIPIAFISVVLLPIVGNAAEHASAVMSAMKDKLDISLGVAIGSSTQISMFGVGWLNRIPFCVVIGWIMGQPMDLNFHLFETASLLITVLDVAFWLQDATSNYLEGLMLFFCYLIVAASFYVHAVPNIDGQLSLQGSTICKWYPNIPIPEVTALQNRQWMSQLRFQQVHCSQYRWSHMRPHYRQLLLLSLPSLS